MAEKIVTDDRARQGPSGRPVLMVLVGSLALLAVVMFGYMSWVGVNTTPTSSGEAMRRSSDPATTSSTNTNSVPAANPSYPAPSNRTAEPNRANEAVTPNGGERR